MDKLTNEAIEKMTYNDLGAALKGANLEVPQSKADRVAALVAANADQASDEGAKDEGAKDEGAKEGAKDEGAKKAPEQLGFGKRIGAQSTAPKKPASMQRPYLDSPRPFGIHIKGHLVRFPAGRTPINDEHPLVQGNSEVSSEDMLEALKTDSYVADNGAEVVE